MSSSGVFGLHLGNTSASIALNKDGKCDVVANEAGDRVTPAFVALQEQEIVVGLPAKQNQIRNAALTVKNAFQFIDELNEDEFDEAVAATKACKVVRSGSSGVIFHLQKDDISRKLTAEEVATYILRNINSIANHAVLTDTNHQVVLSVPLYFSQAGRKSLARAAEKAGFQVLQIISDPAAALLAYDIGQKDLSETLNVIVYRLGGISADVTLVRVSQGLYEVVGNVHERKLGGKLLTDLLTDYLAKEFFQKYKLDPNESRRTMAKLAAHAETAKHVLSTMQSAHIFIESLMDGVDWSYNLSRARFESLIASALAAYKDPIDRLQVGTERVDKIILCGGTMKVPKLQATLAGMFPEADVLASITPDEAIAIGCAKQAALLSKPWDDEFEHLDMEVETLPVDLVAIVEGQKEEIELFKRGALVSAETKFAASVEEGESQIKLNLFERNPESSEKTELGLVELEVTETTVQLLARLSLSGLEIKVA